MSNVLQTFQLGGLTLESGAVIPDLRMSCLTHGTLNADRSNAILSLHGLRGSRNAQSLWVGEDNAFDPGRYFIIQPDTLGAATLDPEATTSPTRSGLKMRFPRFTIRDMVRAEHRLLTAGLGIHKLVAVSGSSMGGITALQWAVSHPDFMATAIALLPQAWTHRQGNFIWEAARRAIMLDPKWRDGDYPPDDPPRTGTGIGLSIQDAFGASAARFEEEFASAAAVHAAHGQSVGQLGASIDARDWIYRTWALESHDIGQTPGCDGDRIAAARLIRARLLLLPNRQDQLLPPEVSGLRELATHAPNCRLVELDDPGGHTGGPRGTQGRPVVIREIRALLRRIGEEQSGSDWPAPR